MKTLKKVLAVSTALLLPSISFAATADGLVQAGRNLTAGTYATPYRATQDGSIGNQETHAKFQQAVRDGNVYTCANPQGTAVTTQAGLSVTTPALTLYNTSTTKSLVLIEDTIGLNAAPAAADIFSLAYSSGPPTATTAANYVNNLLTPTSAGVAAPAGACYRVSTLNTLPVAFRYLGQVTGASTLTQPIFTDVVDGKVIVGPGEAITFQTTSAAAIVGSMTWEEIPFP
jgi:hypothetical protein